MKLRNDILYKIIFPIDKVYRKNYLLPNLLNIRMKIFTKRLKYLCFLKDNSKSWILNVS